jgi:hypothetical protein
LTRSAAPAGRSEAQGELASGGEDLLGLCRSHSERGLHVGHATARRNAVGLIGR